MLADLMEAWEPTYSELEEYYSKYFTLSNLNTSFDNKIKLISLVCYLTIQLRKKHPDTTCYQTLMKIVGDIPQDKYTLEFIRGVSIICEDYLKNNSEFPTFKLKSGSEIVNVIKQILSTWMPF